MTSARLVTVICCVIGLAGGPAQAIVSQSKSTRGQAPKAPAQILRRCDLRPATPAHLAANTDETEFLWKPRSPQHTLGTSPVSVTQDKIYPAENHGAALPANISSFGFVGFDALLGTEALLPQGGSAHPDLEDALYFARRASQQIANLEAGLSAMGSLPNTTDMVQASDTMARSCAAVGSVLADLERSLGKRSNAQERRG